MLVVLEGVGEGIKICCCFLGKILVNKAYWMQFFGILSLVTTVSPFLLCPFDLPHLKSKYLFGFFACLLLDSALVQCCFFCYHERFPSQCIHHALYFLRRSREHLRFLSLYFLTLAHGLRKLSIDLIWCKSLDLINQIVINRPIFPKRSIKSFSVIRQRSSVVSPKSC